MAKKKTPKPKAKPKASKKKTSVKKTPSHIQFKKVMDEFDIDLTDKQVADMARDAASRKISIEQKEQSTLNSNNM